MFERIPDCGGPIIDKPSPARGCAFTPATSLPKGIKPCKGRVYYSNGEPTKKYIAFCQKVNER